MHRIQPVIQEFGQLSIDSLLLSPPRTIINKTRRHSRSADIRQLIPGVPSVRCRATGIGDRLQIAVVVERHVLVAEHGLEIRRVIASRARRLRYPRARPGAADLGPVAGFVVLVGQIAPKELSRFACM